MAQLVPIRSTVAPPIPIQRPILLIGRHIECDLRIDLPQVSRRHCCLALAYDRLIIRDLGSRHGVRVNGAAVEEKELRDGDEVAIAHLIYRVEVAQVVVRKTPAAPSPPPAPRPSPIPADLPPSLVDFEDEFIPLSD